MQTTSTLLGAGSETGPEIRAVSYTHLDVYKRQGVTGDGTNKHVIEFSLKLDSNPEFTGSVLAACARAAYRMNQEGQSGCKTIFDIAPAYLSAQSGEELRAHML